MLLLKVKACNSLCTAPDPLAVGPHRDYELKLDGGFGSLSHDFDKLIREMRSLFIL